MEIKQVLKKQIKLIKPDKELLNKISQTANNFCKQLAVELRKKKIDAKVFIGGSLAKNTLVKKDKYDIDVFVRFNEKYDNKISSLLEKILKSKKAKKLHGSRDYYQLIVDGITIEIVPVIKIEKPQDAKNVTDLSYFHVNYVLNKVKKKKLGDEIILAKSFAHAQGVYGAESYIKGFSGYALELLVCYYRSFEKFIKAIAKSEENEKIIIDDSKFYKKNLILKQLNESKLQSPIILIDPTFKQRNALAGLNKETFDKFKKACKDFLKSPSNKFFEKQNLFEKLKKKYKNLKIISVKTNKQAGDIAGTKSKKFFEFFIYKLKRQFEIKKAEFEYFENKNLAYFYFAVNKKKDEIIKGPLTEDKKNLKRFKKVHKKTFVKNKRVCTKLIHNLSFETFLKQFVKKEKTIIKEMGVKGIGLVN